MPALLMLDMSEEVKDTPYFSELGEFFLKAVKQKENTHSRKAKDQVFGCNLILFEYFTL